MSWKKSSFFCLLFVTLLIFFDLLDYAQTCIVEKTGEQGECKFISKCPKVLNQFQKTREKPTICDFTLRTICCPIEKPKNLPVPSTESTSSRISQKKCREYGKFFEQTVTTNSLILGQPSVQTTLKKCNYDSLPLIANGQQAKEKEFPHMALIGFGEGNPEDYSCGGSLISHQWILSAAHCASNRGLPANFAKLGNVTRYTESTNSYIYNIIERISHPNYTRRHADNDIALFKLNEAVTFSEYVLPICLVQTESLTTKRAIVTGWGKTGYFNDVSNSLMKVTIDYFNREQCDDIFRNVDRLKKGEIDWERMLCAGSYNKSGDSCQGDSGGPLQITNKDVHCMYSIVGITSFGQAYCGLPDVPAIYTKVFFFLNWIESIVWPNE